MDYFCTMKNFIRKYPLSLAVIAAILYLSLSTPPKTGLDPIPGIDKIVHLCMYGGLELIIWLEYLRHHQILERKKIIWLAIIAPILLGGAVEIAQATLTENRSCELADLIADAAGVFAGAAAGYLSHSLKGRRVR